MTNTANVSSIVGFLWQIAEKSRSGFSKNENQKFILPFTVLRRFDYALEPTKEKVLTQEKTLKERGLENRHDALCQASGFSFYNTSRYNFDTLLDDPDNLKTNLPLYLRSFSPNVAEIFERFDFFHWIDRLDEVNRLYHVMSEFNRRDRCDLSSLNNHEMGYVFEHLIRQFNEAIDENPGEHYTPRDAITLLVKLVATLDTDLAGGKLVSRTVADCCVGTGGILSIFKDEIATLNPNARIFLYGQELNPQTWAICLSDMLITDPSGESANNIRLGSTLSNDHFENMRFDFQFANPPYGMDWTVDEQAVLREAKRGSNGRFSLGRPGKKMGELLFLQHMIAHMTDPTDKPSYIGIFLNGSPLFTGEAGSGESEIRRWILEKDLLDSIIALPEQIFYNTSIATYLWILSNKKPKERGGKVMLMDASGEKFWSPMRKSLGAKRREITEERQDTILELFKSRLPGEHLKIFDTTDFGYHRIQVERPLKLNFSTSEDRLENLEESTPFKKLATSKKRDEKARKEQETAGRQQQDQIIDVLKSLTNEIVKDREVFQTQLVEAFKVADVKLTAPIRKAILAALSERDETAEPCLNSDGSPEPDPALRDHENVPLKEDVDEYFQLEVVPHVSDAWIDHDKTKIGYEIPFNRHFYVFKPPRELDEIDEELKGVTDRLVEMIGELS